MTDQELVVVDENNEALKLRCYGLYLTGISAESIAGDVGLPSRLIRRWIREEDWNAERETIHILSKSHIRDEVAVDIVGTHAKQLQLARQIQNVVEDKLYKMAEDTVPQLKFRSWDELTRVLERSMALQNQALASTIEEDFVLKIIQAINEIELDHATKQKLAERIGRIFGERQNSSGSAAAE